MTKMKILKQIATIILKDELEDKSNEISNLSLVLKSYIEDIYALKYPDPLEDYYNTKYPKTKKLYNKKFLSRYIGVDVRCFVGNYHNYRLPIFSSKDDELAIEALQWIVKNKTYQSDSKSTGLAEYWNFSFESKELTFMDCEDGAILLYDILRANNIPAWRLRIVCGWAISPWSGKSAGHAYLAYYSKTHNKWVALDWCYLPNVEPMETQPEYKDVGFYGDVWFSFNENYSWSKAK